MKYFRLNNNNEYFNDEGPIAFLGQIAGLNIMVGANNTRKSRLLRAMISQEHHLLIEGAENFDLIYKASLTIFDALNQQDKETFNDRFLQLVLSGIDSKDLTFQNVKAFQQERNQIDFFEFKTALNRLNEDLMAMSNDSEFTKFRDSAQKAQAAVRMFLWVFNKIEKSVPQHTQAMDTDIEYIRYKVTLPSNQIWPDFKLKHEALRQLNLYLGVLTKLKFERFNKNLIYIPVLRTSRMITGFEKDVFADTLLEQHFPSPPPKLSIETGLKLYKKISLARNTTREKARDFTAFERFIGETFFRGGDVHIVAEQTEKNDQRNIMVSLPGEGEDKPIQDLGDGIQAIINLLFPVFTAGEGDWLFIDEPENHMHPGYQRLFIQALAENELIKSKKLRFFINTHSNHILSAAFLMQKATELMVFKRRDKVSSIIASFNGLEYHTLELLGVFNTSVLTSNCTVWVEGVTDRFYLQAFLHAYLNRPSAAPFKPTEGLHYSFVEYGGKNLVHYEFDHEVEPGDDAVQKRIRAYFLNANVFLVADSDFNAERHFVLEEIKRDNFKFVQTGLPEIENLLPEAVLGNFLKEILHAKPDEIERCFSDNTILKLGDRWKSKLKCGNSFRKIDGPGGTLKPFYKKSLADFVHQQIIKNKIDWATLENSQELKQLTENLYLFIESKNNY